VTAAVPSERMLAAGRAHGGGTIVVDPLKTLTEL
jgi:hypothetical protein